MPIETKSLTTPQHTATKAQMLRAAAEALMLDEAIAVEIAGVETGAFVRNSRQTYRQNGFNFTDDDLRVIHESVRKLCLRRNLHRRILTPQDKMFADIEKSMKAKKSFDPGKRFIETTPQGRKETA